MKKYELLSHTADIRILAQGSTLEELFEAALEALCRIIGGNEPVIIEDETIEIEFAFESVDITALLIDFLSEALFFIENEKILIIKAPLLKIKGNKLKVKLTGKHIKRFYREVKAVTYHEANIIINEDDLYETIVVLDI